MRSRALQVSTAVVLCFALLGIGCQNQDLGVLAITLGNAVAAIADLQGQTELAAKLRADAQAVKTAIDAWHPGKPAGDVIRLINKLISDLNLLPLNDKYRPFIILALGTAAHIIDLLNASSPDKGVAQTNVHLTNPPNNDKEFRRTWDAIRDATPDASQIPVL